MHYLYLIINGKNGKVYIGQSIDEKCRWKQHKYQSQRDQPSQEINRAMKQDGIENELKIEIAFHV